MRNVGIVLFVGVLAAACGGEKKDGAGGGGGGDKDNKDSKEGGTGKKGKTSESMMNLKKIYDGARAYYMEEGATRGSMTPVPRQFPASSPMTPPVGSCCPDKCAPDPKLWATDGWNALHFSMDDPHYYSYEFVSEGTGADAKFTARVMGDLDCDGSYSTFEMVGRADAAGNVIGAAGVFKSNELE